LKCKRILKIPFGFRKGTETSRVYRYQIQGGRSGGGGGGAHKVALKQSGSEQGGAGNNCRMLGSVVKGRNTDCGKLGSARSRAFLAK
jgi:hypothetical protein